MSDYRVFIGREDSPTTGAWIELDETMELSDVLELARPHLRGAEEWNVMDHEGFDGNRFSLQEMLTYIKAVELDEVAGPWMTNGCANMTDSPEDIVSQAQEAHYMTLDATYEDKIHEEFGYEMLESTGDMDLVPEYLRCHIDFKGFGRDLLISDYFYVVWRDQCYIYSNH